MAHKQSNIIEVDWSVNGFYCIAVALENNDNGLLIGNWRSFIFFVTMI